jgi:metal-sulfur cluster biosynthetic enzyme
MVSTREHSQIEDDAGGNAGKVPGWHTATGLQLQALGGVAMSIDIEAVRVAAGSTPDPEVRCSIAELGLLDEITVEGSGVTVHYHLTSPLCPAQFATKIGKEIRRRVMAVPGVEACEVVIQDHFLRDEIQQQINLIPGRRGKGQPIIKREVDQ